MDRKAKQIEFMQEIPSIPTAVFIQLCWRIPPASLESISFTNKHYRSLASSILQEPIYWKMQCSSYLGVCIPDNETVPKKGNLTWKKIYTLFHKGRCMMCAYPAYLCVTYGKVDLNQAFLASVMRGHTKLVRTLLRMGVDPSVYDNRAIVIAADKGHLKIVKLLLANPSGGNTTAKYNEPFQKAIYKGHLKIALLIKEEPRFNVMDFLKFAVTVSAGYGRLNILQYMLSNYQRSIRQQNLYEALSSACGGGHLECVKLLMPLVTPDTWVRPTSPLYASMRSGRTEIVRMLFQHMSAMDILYDVGIPLTAAAERGHYECVKLGLENTRRLINTGNYDALTEAMWRGHEDVVSLLLSDPRTRSAISEKTRLEARQRGHGKCVDLVEAAMQ